MGYLYQDNGLGEVFYLSPVSCFSDQSLAETVVEVGPMTRRHILHRYTQKTHLSKKLLKTMSMPNTLGTHANSPQEVVKQLRGKCVFFLAGTDGNYSFERHCCREPLILQKVDVQVTSHPHVL